MIDLDLKQKIILGLKYPNTAANFLTDKIFYQNKETPYPRIINCFITEKCNFNCPMCHVKESRQKNMVQLSFSVFQNLVKETAFSAPSFQLTGGEPLLHPEIEKIIGLLTEKRMVKGLVTNGLLLEEKADAIVNAGLDFLAVSLDGPDEDTQYKRGLVKGSFNKIIRGVKKVLQARGKNLFPNIRIATVISKTNIHNFDEVLKVAEKMDADQWSLSHYFYYSDRIGKMQLAFASQHGVGKEVWGENIGRKGSLFLPTQREIIRSKYKRLSDYKRSGKSKIRISLPPDVDIEKYYTGKMPSLRSICTSPYNQVFIRGNGDVEMCQGYILGNIKEDKIRDIWQGEKASHFREVFSRVGIMPSCFRCCSLNIKFD